MKNVAMLFLVGVVLTLTFVPSISAAEPQVAFGGGGPSLGLFMPSMTRINAFVEDAGFQPFEGNLFLIGGSGGGGLAPGATYGGSGWAAWIESSRGERHAEYSAGFGGFEMGYALGGDASSILGIGLTLGGGAVELALTEELQAVPLEFGPHGIVVEPTRFTYDSVFFFAAPYIEMQVQLLDWVGIGVRGGVVWSPIELNGSDEGPLEAPVLAPSGPYVSLSVVFGGITWLDSPGEGAP